MCLATASEAFRENELEMERECKEFNRLMKENDKLHERAVRRFFSNPINSTAMFYELRRVEMGEITFDEYETDYRDRIEHEKVAIKLEIKREKEREAV